VHAARLRVASFTVMPPRRLHSKQQSKERFIDAEEACPDNTHLRTAQCVSKDTTARKTFGLDAQCHGHKPMTASR